MGEHDDLSPHLRAAYEDADPELAPSALLRARVLEALEARGHTVPRRGHWGTAALGLAAGLVGFFLGAQPWAGEAREDAPPPAPPSATALVAAGGADGDIEAALQEVQRTATAHARALDRMVGSLDRIDASTLVGAQELYLAAERTRRVYGRLLLAGRTTVAEEEPASGSAPGAPVVWF